VKRKKRKRERENERRDGISKDIYKKRYGSWKIKKEKEE